MKPQEPFTELAELEKELAHIAPFVRRGFSRSGPSPLAEEMILREARRVADQRRRRAWPLYRSMAAAAALALLLGGGAFQLRQSRHAALEAARQRTASETARSGDASDGFANLLLEIQGLNEEGFFRHEEVAAL